MIKYLGLGDYLTIAELILGIDGELLAKGVGIGLVDSALAAPQASFDGIEFYPELERKAAVLLEHLVKNHPLPDGKNARPTPRRGCSSRLMAVREPWRIPMRSYR
ncbi:MAG: type II toxin-antitoxin system death-on-curing family toxin [Ferrimicrobium sp.]|uniref:Type II toxin-antitoxin system death-on-curing family toxin n=1 Tax=Ferrimicrobium acidiphilum TaxID=121039 RepID=A0ABV3Y4K4_9ACTN|nr:MULTISPECIES: Fic family protein [Ferrimicrobium]